MAKMDRFLPGLTAGLVLGGAMSAFASAKTYQYTGRVKDTSKTEIDVDKGGEIWKFAIDDHTSGGLEAKAGDSVTVTYRMYATRVEKH